MAFCYTRFACPCTDITPSSKHFRDFNLPLEEQEIDEQPLNPHSPRANYILYPLHHLLFCNDCHEIRCPRCYYEETVHHYCPNCLFEVGKATVKNETNRCTRSCFECPLCTATLAISSYQATGVESTGSTETSISSGPFILTCPYCAWSSLDIDVTFEKSTNISGQLAKQKAGLHQRQSSQDVESDKTPLQSADSSQYQQLVSFYKQQFMDANPSSGIAGGSGFGLDSPSLFRLLSNYGHGGLRKPRGKVPSMREAHNEGEGLADQDLNVEDALIGQIERLGWDNTLSVPQRNRQDKHIHLVDNAQPVPMLLRSKRAKRCRKCRHQLAKQDEKLHSTKWRIRLVAVNYIPSVSVRPFATVTNLASLHQNKTLQFLVTLRNPLFDPIKVSLATPTLTPGKVKSKVILLCPQFDVGAAADVWDEALDAEAKRQRESGENGETGQQLEAGKVWEKGRNWTTVACEVIPGSLDGLDLDPGDEFLEVPIHIHVSYEMDEASITSPLEGPRDKLQKEISFWAVLGVGKIRR